MDLNEIWTQGLRVEAINALDESVVASGLPKRQDGMYTFVGYFGAEAQTRADGLAKMLDEHGACGDRSISQKLGHSGLTGRWDVAPGGRGSLLMFAYDKVVQAPVLLAVIFASTPGEWPWKASLLQYQLVGQTQPKLTLWQRIWQLWAT
jgi:hypothetical protein